jgi:iron complex transport system permease protein
VVNKKTHSNSAAQYHEHIRRKIFTGIILIILLVISSLAALKIGSYPLTVSQIFSTIQGNGNEITGHIIWNIRLPRLFAALIGGASLALAGTIMQNVLRNPLGSPFTLGVAQGAACGAAFAIIVLGAGSVTAQAANAIVMQSTLTVVLSAFTGSLITISILMILSAIKELTPAGLILAGVALSAFFSALTMLLQYFASDIEVAAAVFWTFGDLGKAGWSNLIVMAIILIPAVIYFGIKRWAFNAMLWGDDTAKSLGINTYRLRLTALMLAALISAVTTAFLGIIGFIGLIAPHIVKMIIGDDHCFVIPLSAIAGAILLLFADIAARLIMEPVILPVGILTSFAGVPVFFYLLMTRKTVWQ